MKKLLILALFIASYSQAQQYDTWVQSDTLVGGTDTLVVDTCKSFIKYAYLTVQDTGTTNTDSVLVDVWDVKLNDWVTVGVRDVLSYTDFPVASPGGGYTKTYLVLYAGLSRYSIIRHRLANATFVNGRRVLTSWRFVNN